MNNLVAVSATGMGGTSAILVGEGIVKVNIPACASDKPSIFMMDLLSGAFEYSFTIGNSITVIGLGLTAVSMYLAINKYIRHKRRKGE